MSQGTTELQRPVPLYVQVVRQLRAQIASGELAEGDRIPSQREMMARWRISMQTASKVIGALKTEGLAIPSVGRDTIVALGAAARIAAASEGAYRAAASGPLLAPALEVKATATRAAAPAPVAEILGIPAGRRALRRQETHRDGGQTVSVTITWFPPALADKAPHLAHDAPLPAGALAYISEATGTRAARATEENAAVPAGADAAKALGVPTGSPVLVTSTQYHSADGKAIAHAETSTIAERWRTRTYTITGN